GNVQPLYKKGKLLMQEGSGMCQCVSSACHWHHDTPPSYQYISSTPPLDTSHQNS
ncbi:hypothetical protein BaRGS_00010654, partial [Batillaria attramentaria]